MKISNLYGRKITCEDGKRSGTVMTVYHLNGKLDGCICFDEDEKEFFAHGVCVKKSGEITFCRTGKKSTGAIPLRLGIPVYGTTGKYLGNASDFCYKGNRLCTVAVNGRRYSLGGAIVYDAVILREKTARTDAERAAKDMFISALCGDGQSDLSSIGGIPSSQ